MDRTCRAARRPSSTLLELINEGGMQFLAALERELRNAEHIPELMRVITSVNRGMPEDWSMGGGRGRGIQMGVAHSNAEVCAYSIHGVLASCSAQYVEYDRPREKKSCAEEMCSLISIFASSESAYQ